MGKSKDRYAHLQNPHLPDFKTFIEEHGPLVRKIAYHLPLRLPANVDTDDLIQTGMIALIDVYKNYDDAKGASIKTYASIRIRGAMIDELRKQGWLPRSVHRESKKLAEAVRQVEQRTGGEAVDREVAHELGISLPELQSLMFECNQLQWTGLEDPSIDEHEFLANVITPIPRPDEAFASENFCDHLMEALTRLGEREQLILSLYYIEEMNLKEIGATLGITESRVSQVHSRAMSRLHELLNEWAQA